MTVATQAEAVQAHVRQYIKMGLCCLPLRQASKKPDFSEEEGWTPWVENWLASPPDPDQVIDRFQHGVALCLGRFSKGMFVFDIDSPDLAEAFLNQYQGFEETTPVVKSHRGIHIWLRQKMAGIIPNKGADYFENDHGWNMDLLGDKHLITAPPSIHPEGTRYSFIAKPQEILEVDDALEWLSVWLEPFGITFRNKDYSYSGGELRIGQDGVVAAGGRHDFMKSECGYIARTCVRAGYGLAVAVDMGLQANEAKCIPPLPDEEVIKIQVWAYRQEKGKGGLLGGERQL